MDISLITFKAMYQPHHHCTPKLSDKKNCIKKAL